MVPSLEAEAMRWPLGAKATAQELAAHELDATEVLYVRREST